SNPVRFNVISSFVRRGAAKTRSQSITWLIRQAKIVRNGPMRLLTITEAADYLSLKDRKLYELASDGTIPCTKITGRWLFPKHELDRWLGSRALRPDGVTSPDPMPIIGGSHDPLLEWALRESGSGLATLPEGSAAGLSRFVRGE